MYLSTYLHCTERNFDLQNSKNNLLHYSSNAFRSLSLPVPAVVKSNNKLINNDRCTGALSICEFLGLRYLWCFNKYILY